jgi:hypothetical protein
VGAGEQVFQHDLRGSVFDVNIAEPPGRVLAAVFIEVWVVAD